MNIEQLSAWMDGELNRDLEEKILTNWLVDDSSAEVWNTYHVIGEVLREPDITIVDLSSRVMKAIELENIECSAVPVVDKMHSVYGSWKFWGIAASLLISLTGVGFLLSPPNPETKSLMLAQENSTPPVSHANIDLPQSSAYYVFLHHEVSPMSGFQTVDYPIAQ